MPKIPTYESQNKMQAVDTAQTRVDPRVQSSAYAETKVAQKQTLSSIFKEAGQFYGARYEASKRAQQTVEIAKIGADATRYSRDLMEAAKKIDNEEEGLKYYQEGMSKFLEERTGQLNDPQMKAMVFKDINETSMQGEHNLFNYGQQRRKSKAIGAIQEGLQSLDSAALAANGSEISKIYSQADALLDGAVTAGYIMPEEAIEGKAQFRKGVGSSRIVSAANSGNLSAARTELDANRPYLSSQQVVQFEGAINREEKKMQAEAVERVKQQSRMAQLGLAQALKTGEAIDPDAYLQKMLPEDRAVAEVALGKNMEEQDALVDAMNTFRANPVVATDEDRRIADKVFIDDVILPNATPQEKELKTQDFIMKHGVVPSLLKKEYEMPMMLSAFNENGEKGDVDPMQKFQAALKIDEVRQLNGTAYNSFDKSARIQSRQIAEWAKKGYTEIAVKELEKNINRVRTDPEFVENISKEKNYDFSAKEVANIMRSDSGLFLRLDSLMTPDPTVTTEIHNAAMNIYSNTYKEARLNGADETVAYQIAMEDTQNMFGTSYVNADRKADFSERGEVMMLPPEKFLPQHITKKFTAPEDRIAFVKRDFESYLESIGKKRTIPKDGKKYDGVSPVYRAEVDSQTMEDYKNGLVPSYSISEMGVTNSGRPVVRFLEQRWRPAAWR